MRGSKGNVEVCKCEPGAHHADLQHAQKTTRLMLDSSCQTEVQPSWQTNPPVIKTSTYICSLKYVKRIFCFRNQVFIALYVIKYCVASFWLVFINLVWQHCFWSRGVKVQRGDLTNPPGPFSVVDPVQLVLMTNENTCRHGSSKRTL